MIRAMASIKGDYWQCYLDGRADKLLRNDIDAQQLADDVVGKGGTLRDVVASACNRVAAPMESGRAKQRWVSEAAAFIKTAGGDADAAYAAYLQGRIDKLAVKTERRVVEALEEMFPAGEADDDDDEADDEGEDEGEDEE